jgi:hypothetical protein
MEMYGNMRYYSSVGTYEETPGCKPLFLQGDEGMDVAWTKLGALVKVIIFRCIAQHALECTMSMLTIHMALSFHAFIRFKI